MPCLYTSGDRGATATKGIMGRRKVSGRMNEIRSPVKDRRPVCTTGEGAGKELCSLGRFLAGSVFSLLLQLTGHELATRDKSGLCSLQHQR